MKKPFFTILLSAMVLPLAAQMTDEQVIDFVVGSSRQGASQADMASQLMARGVTPEQLTRISENGGVASAASAAASASPATSRERIAPTIATAATYAAPATESDIFGHNIFSGRQLTFEPSLNIATPDNYVLGPGDEVIIDIWGDSEQNVRQTISPDGTIVINRLGPVALNGLSVKEAGVRLERRFASIYSALEGDRPATFVKLSLGQIRSIQVHVMGEVASPGTYTVSSLASLFHVLYTAGGVNPIGSLRSIGVSRAGERVADVDVYSYLLEGRTDVDIALKDGDVVMVAPYKNLVEIAGGVKRPMRYEMKAGEAVASLLDFAGGFAGDSYRGAVTVVRRSGRMQEVHNIGRGDFGRFALNDGDRVTVGGIIDRFENRLEITGAVFRPGLYALSDSVATVGRLIREAEGFRGDAFTGRAILTREKTDYSHEVVSLDVDAILYGDAPDVALRNGDVLHIPSVFDLREGYVVSIQGAVRSPGEYSFADNLSIEDLIVRAGGLLESASTAKVDIFRRVKNPSATAESSLRSVSYTLPIRGGLVVTEGTGFALQPFDVVNVRTSPGYEAQKSVSVQGEVLFPGSYSLMEREERLSLLVARAGGHLSKAYLRGASLIRRMSPDEAMRTRSMRRLPALGGNDSLSMGDLNISETYPVAIRLDRAIADPGSDYDLVLREGDVLRVPEYVGTVAISGAVLYPNTVSFDSGMSVRDYIEQAGGYVDGARRKARFVVYMNGNIARGGFLKRTRIEPGCEIVVPHKQHRRRVSAAEILGVTSSITSSALLGTSIANTLKK